MAVDIVLADDHGVLRAGLRALLNAEDDLEVVGEAATGDEVLRVAERYELQVTFVANTYMLTPEDDRFCESVEDSLRYAAQEQLGVGGCSGQSDRVVSGDHDTEVQFGE